MSVEKVKAFRIQKLKEMLAQNNNDLFAKYGLAMEYLSENKITETELLLTEIINFEPNYVPAYYQLGILYYGLDNNEKALPILQTGLEKAKITQQSLKTLNEFRSAIDEILY